MKTAVETIVYYSKMTGSHARMEGEVLEHEWGNTRVSQKAEGTGTNVGRSFYYGFPGKNMQARISKLTERFQWVLGLKPCL